MTEHEFEDFSALVDQQYSLATARIMPAEAKALFFAALAEYPLHAIRQAIFAHIKDPVNGKFPVQPAHLIAHLKIDDGRPAAEEAWAIAYAAADERETVVWTTEIATAFDAARTLLAPRITVEGSGEEAKRKVSKGDEVGARMAFKDAYTRLVAAARERREPVRWLTQLGWNAAGREAKLLEAVRLQRLPAAKIAHLLPAPEILAIEFDGAAQPETAEAGLSRLKALLATMPTQAEKLERAATQRIARERRDLAQAKAKAAHLVAEHEAHA